MAAICAGMRSLAAYPAAPAPLCTANTTGAPAALTASQIASTWSWKEIADRSESADSRPGSVKAVTSCPSSRNAAATSSHAHAPSQNPGTRTIGAAFTPWTLLTGAVSLGERGPPEARDDVVVDEPGGLHKGVADRR